MGGYGSGRPNWRELAEDMIRLDLAAVQRAGYLRPGQCTRALYRWPGHNQTVLLEIDMTAAPAWVTFRQPQAGAWADLGARVPLTTTAQPLGGVRWWWLCRCCGRRARVLYLPPGAAQFACQRCYRLTYASSQSSDKRVSALAADPLLLAECVDQANAGDPRALLLALRAYRLLERRQLHRLPPGRRRRLAAALGIDP